MLIQATSWPDATQMPSLLNGSDLGWGETMCVYYINVCVCRSRLLTYVNVSKTHIHSRSTIGLRRAEIPHLQAVFMLCHPHNTHIHLPPPHLFPASVQMWRGRRCSPLPRTLSLMKKYSWQMLRNAMKMAVC